jgi:hypothetical protein
MIQGALGGALFSCPAPGRAWSVIGILAPQIAGLRRHRSGGSYCGAEPRGEVPALPRFSRGVWRDWHRGGNEIGGLTLTRTELIPAAKLSNQIGPPHGFDGISGHGFRVKPGGSLASVPQALPNCRCPSSCALRSSALLKLMPPRLAPRRSAPVSSAALRSALCIARSFWDTNLNPMLQPRPREAASDGTALA